MCLSVSPNDRTTHSEQFHSRNNIVFERGKVDVFDDEGDEGAA